MAVVYVLAHFDDEVFAAPLIRDAVRAGTDQWFLYVTDYATPALAEQRLAETRRMLTHLGVAPERAIHVGAGLGCQDGSLHLSMETAFTALKRAVDGLGPVERFVTTGYEGGHADHDCCAVMTLVLAEAANAPVDQFSLYNAKGLPHPLFRSAAPVSENGPVRKTRVSLAQLVAWVASVRFFPSQALTWLGLGPTLFWSVLIRGFGAQTLEPRRARERPHVGPLLYEQRFGVAYDDMRDALDAFLARKA